MLEKPIKVPEGKRLLNFWRTLGPGLTTGAADDDPSGIATYSQTGAQFGLKYAWLALFTFPLMALVQEMCARIGLVTGRGLAANIRSHFPRWVLMTCTILLFAANAFNIGADLGAMSEAIRLLAPNLPFEFLVIVIAGSSLLLQIFVPYHKYSRYLKYLAITLLSYVITGFLVKLDWGLALKSLVIPSLSFGRESIVLITAILGTTISPYLFFWQTSQEVEEEIENGKRTVAQRKRVDPNDLSKMRFDVWSGMGVSNIVMFFIIAVCAGTLYAAGVRDITSAAAAAKALEPLAGRFASAIFAVGIIGTGLLAVPVLAGSAAYAFAEALRWREGLYRQYHQAKAFYGVIIVAILVGLGTNLLHIDPFKTLIYSAVANAFVSPLVLALIVIIAGNKKVMGKHRNKITSSLFGWALVLVMTFVCILSLAII